MFWIFVFSYFNEILFLYILKDFLLLMIYFTSNDFCLHHTQNKRQNCTEGNPQVAALVSLTSSPVTSVPLFLGELRSTISQCSITNDAHAMLMLIRG